MAGIPCDGIVAQETSGPSTSLGMTVWGRGRDALAGKSFRLPWMAYTNPCSAAVFQTPRITTVRLVSRWLAVSACNAYPAAIMGTAARAAIIPTVFQRVNRSPKKMRARMTVSAG